MIAPTGELLRPMARVWLAAPAAARAIDATGEVVIPGLWDMHVHTDFGTWVPGGDEVTLPLLLAQRDVAAAARAR